MAKEKEAVNHPQHYGGDTTYEVIKVLEAWDLDFCLGNTVKYIARMGKKGLTHQEMIEDLRKAEWYLQRRLKRLKEELALQCVRCGCLLTNSRCLSCGWVKPVEIKGQGGCQE